MKSFVKAYILIFLTAVAGFILLNLHNTAGTYGAVIYYEKTKEGYVLKGMEVYAKPVRTSGYHNVELVASFSPLVDFNSSVVKIEHTYSPSKRVASSEIHVYTGKTILLKPNAEVRAYVSLGDCLTAKEPIKFRVLLSPVEGGWVVNVDNVSVVILPIS